MSLNTTRKSTERTLQSDMDSVSDIKPEIVAPGAATDYEIKI
jgi:hypothetical protein